MKGFVMNTEHRMRKTEGRPVPAALALLCLFLQASSIPLRAEISEPDNVIYGSIVISNTPITAADTDVVIEARRTVNGPALASYAMGSDDRLGNFFSLALKFESVGGVSDTNASTAGQQVIIVVTDNGTVVGQTGYAFPERGHLQRVDFGAPLEDADGNGLPDLWELTWLGAPNNDPNALGANGQTLIANYVAGTDPGDADDLFRVEIDRAGDAVDVWFPARRAEGPGYANKARVYTLESRPALGGGGWSDVTGVSGVVGDNQLVVHTDTELDPALFYRAQVALTNLSAVQLIGGPRLSIEASGLDSVRLSWPSVASGFALQESTSLTAGGWTDVVPAPSDDGTNWSVVVTPPSAPRFYRLRD